MQRRKYTHLCLCAEKNKNEQTLNVLSLSERGRIIIENHQTIISNVVYALTENELEWSRYGCAFKSLAAGFIFQCFVLAIWWQHKNRYRFQINDRERWIFHRCVSIPFKFVMRSILITTTTSTASKRNKWQRANK